MKNLTKNAILPVVIATGIVIMTACQKQEPIKTSMDKPSGPVLKTTIVPDCQSLCINNLFPEYYSMSDQVTIKWGGQKHQKSKTVDIEYYNTDSQFILKVKSTNGWNDLVIDSVSAWTAGPVPADQWGEHVMALPPDWEACDLFQFELQVAGIGPPSCFTISYPLIGICTNENIADYDGNIYPTVAIGDQVWMAENLKVTHLNDGTPIANIQDGAAWNAYPDAAYAWFDNDMATYKDIYGALYNWAAVSTGQLCPCGYHVPSRDEWMTMANYLGGLLVAGGKMKITGTVPDPHPRWVFPNTGATNESGFSGLPGGLRQAPYGDFEYLEAYGFWWSSTSNTNPAANAYVFGAGFDRSFLTLYSEPKTEGISVRCIKDLP